MLFQIDKIVSLRNQLHSCAEASGKEVKTMMSVYIKLLANVVQSF